MMVVHQIQLVQLAVVVPVLLVAMVLHYQVALVVLDLHIIFLELLFSMPVVVAVEQELVELLVQVVLV
jgi:hypothetical protein